MDWGIGFCASTHPSSFSYFMPGLPLCFSTLGALYWLDNSCPLLNSTALHSFSSSYLGTWVSYESFPRGLSFSALGNLLIGFFKFLREACWFCNCCCWVCMNCYWICMYCCWLYMNVWTFHPWIISAQQVAIISYMHGLRIQVVLEAFILQIGYCPTRNLDNSSNYGCMHLNRYCFNSGWSLHNSELILDEKGIDL